MSKTIELTNEQIAALCPQKAPSQCVMVRSDRAGVFYGELVKKDGTEVTLKRARRCWYWSGAASLSQLATDGTSKPSQCKFPTATSGEHIILGVCEIIPVTSEALQSLDSVPVWRQ